MSDNNSQQNELTALILTGIAIVLIAIDIYDFSGYTIPGFSIFADMGIERLKEVIWTEPLLLKLVAIPLVFFSGLLSTVQKKDKIPSIKIVIPLLLGFALFLLPGKIIASINNPIIYAVTTVVGFILFTYGFVLIRKLINIRLMDDRFGREGRKFKQTKSLVDNAYSVNIKTKDGWINVINPFRGNIVIGTPGSGKTYVFIEEAIRQHLMKGFTMCVYDYKFPELTSFTYSYLKNYASKNSARFFVINFDNPKKTHRCNPLNPKLLVDFSDAVESAKTIMLALNRTWIKKQGDFFVESPINFLAASIWGLKLLDDGKYCTFPHLIEFVSRDYDKVFGVLSKIHDPSVSNVLAPFISAYENEVMEQLEGQMASVRLGLSRLTSKLMYWVMSGDDFSLDINNPEDPKVLCIGNNPDRQEIYGAALSLFFTRMIKQINKKHKKECTLIIDELPTLYLGTGTVDNLIATGRSNKIATWLGFQDFTQTIRDYGRDVSNAIVNTVGNIFVGMVKGDTAQQMSRSFGKIKVEKKSVSMSNNGTSHSINEQMEELVPASVISSLTSGEFVGQVADTFEQKMAQKFFHSIAIVEDKIEKKEVPDITFFPKDENNNCTMDKILDANMIKIKNEVEELINKYI
jgi:hypothetical protein